MSEEKQTRLKFKELSPHIEVTFWYALEHHKLHDWKLDEPSVQIELYVPASARGSKQLSHIVTLCDDGFKLPPANHANCYTIPATLINYNTIQQLTELDKKIALQTAGKELVAAIRRGQWDQESLVRGAVFTFADLKTHEFHYCLGFPALDLESPVTVDTKQSAGGILTNEASAAVASHIADPSSSSCLPFVVDVKTGAVHPFTPSTIQSADDSAATVIAFYDTSRLDEFPGWGLRNIIAAIRLTFPQLTGATFLAIRDTVQNSLAFTCSWLPLPAEVAGRDLFKTVGWCESKISVVNMSTMMDPAKLAESSAKLNLSLMKWRMMPDIQLDGIQECKALLLGSGTLGCNIARHLFMWGVTNITLVDRGYVSYSNPVRQTLFELSDVLAEGEARIKSVAAARTLKRILPTANVKGVSLTVRMPGHRVDDSQRENAIRDIKALEDLIAAHDVVFLLTDSRESRWLPTVIATAQSKPVINTALGFDSYVVMRHGLKEQGDARVGCYFCNDVVAPMDSLTARTLDQQCTVTRPGVSAIASAISVEILASLYNHPKRFLCPAYKEDDETNEATTVLGIVPHQIRGNVSGYHLHTLYGQNYQKCTACSDAIVEAYRSRGYDFIIQCLNEPLYMEELTGLKADKEAMAKAYENWDDDNAFDD